jgi:tRNA dimethylallyltransferase
VVQAGARVTGGRIVCITGHTASGKSGLALELARRLPASILSVDSMQVYRGFDIGTAKPTAAEQAEIAHFGIDLCAPSERFSAGAFAAYARGVIAQERAGGRHTLVVGGTGLYLRAMLRGLGPAAPADPALRASLRAEEAAAPGTLHARLAALDPEAAARLHPHDLVRCERALEVALLTGRPISRWQAEHRGAPSPYEPLLLGVRRAPDELRARIGARVSRMLDQGWIDEVERLLASGVTEDMTPMVALGYREIAAHLRGEFDRDELFVRIERATHRFAKRQTTWFNSEPSILWLEPVPDLADRLVPAVQEFLSGGPPPTAEVS